ncbi:MAG: glycosyl hydrolase family 28 protein [Kiritimatiellia bacterium]
MKRLLMGLMCAVAAACGAVEVTVDAAKALGPVKPVNGVGQPPMIDALRGAPLFKYLKEAGIPYSRLHDVGGMLGGGLYVDIPNLFPDFDADETDPKNYRFQFTDAVLRNLERNGVEPFFRLGVTIENFVWYGGPGAFPVLNTQPPKDYAKWARICEHVIRHYTEGWANGPRMKIAYWEIWNEPDNSPDPEKNPMFHAPFEEFMKFYGVAATHLKARFPHLKIGGYGSCGFYAAVGSDHVPAANSSPRMQHFVDCAHKFLAAARQNKWPLDFFSYHSYSDPTEALRQVRFADEILNQYGFTAASCERVFNEWLPFVGHDNLGTALQAAGVAAELLGLQNGPCDLACIYDARCGVGNYSPLFNPLTYKPHKAYSAFLAFNELRRLGTAVACTTSGAGVFASAAAKDGRLAVMIANPTRKAVPLALKGVPGDLMCRLTDATRTHAVVPRPAELPPHSFLVLSPRAEVVVAGRTGREIQAAIDAVAARGGGRVVVPAGEYRTGSLRLRSHVELHLDRGAYLLGGTRSEDYFSFPAKICSIQPERSSKVFLYAWDAEDIAITGEGTIDGQGPKFFDVKAINKGGYYPKPPVERPRMVQFVRCRGVRLQGVTFKDSPCWTMLIRLCEDVAVDGITITADQAMINNDGIDFDGCRRVRVGNSRFKTCDDCLILRAMREKGNDEQVVCEDVVVSNCVLNSRCQTIRLGCPSDDTIRNAVFRDIVAEGNNGIFADFPERYLRADDDGFMDIRNITVENYTGQFTGHAVQIVSESGVKVRKVDNFVFRNLKVKSRRPLRLIGNKGHEIGSVLFENVSFDVEEAGGPLQMRGCTGLVYRNVTANGVRQADGPVASGPGSDAPLRRSKAVSWETR